MKIIMMTNSYAPMVGGIEESIRSFTAEFKKLGHEVMIVAPECEGVPANEVGVVRLKAIEHFNHSDFSIALPMSNLLPELFKDFKPDIIHVHHPFWMGDIALRLSCQYKIPLVFTYHTMFEQHMHYLPFQTEGAKRFIIDLFTGYANLVNQVIVPSESVRDILLGRGVKTPMEVVPTGVDLERFSKGDGKQVRLRLGIPAQAFVIGYIGRLAIEKNLDFLSLSIAECLKNEANAHFLIGGGGPLEEEIKKIFAERNIPDRLHFAGVLKGQELVDAYHAINIFAFASVSETQGLVLVEAMAAGVPVIALDAPGVREVIKDGLNGKLIKEQNQKVFSEALTGVIHQRIEDFKLMKKNAISSTQEFSIESCAKRMLKVYAALIIKEHAWSDHHNSAWDTLTDSVKNEWGMFKNMMHASGSALFENHHEEASQA